MAKREVMTPRGVLWFQDHRGAESVVQFDVPEGDVRISNDNWNNDDTLTVSMSRDYHIVDPTKTPSGRRLSEAAKEVSDNCDELREVNKGRVRLEELHRKLGNDPEEFDMVRLFFQDVLTFRNSVRGLSCYEPESTNPDIYSSETLETWALMAREAGYLAFPVPEEDDMEDDEWEF